MVGRIRGFDGLRAVAVLAVLAVFLGHRSPLHGHAIGHVGVLVFFALSGFLIVGLLNAARTRIEAGASEVEGEMRRFFIHRIRRIFPVYYLVLAALALAALLGLTASGWSWAALPWHILYLSNLFEARAGWQGALSHLWSLSIEEQFYLFAAPLLLVLPARLHLRACGAVAGVGLISHLALLALHAGEVATYTDSLTNFGFLAFGGVLRLSPESERPGWAIKALPLLGAVLLVLGLVPDPAALGSWLILTPLLAALFVGGVAWAQESRLVAWLETPMLVYLGRISYGFYLFHNLFWIRTPLPGRLDTIAGLVLNFAVSFGLAAASWWLIESPILQRRVPWARRQPAAA